MRSAFAYIFSILIKSILNFKLIIILFNYMKKERKIKNENGAKKQQKTTFLKQMIYCDRRV